MAKYKVSITEYQVYDVYVEAKHQAEAEDKALKCYGYEGDVTCSGAEVTEVEEEIE